MEKQELVFIQCGIPEGKIRGWVKEGKKVTFVCRLCRRNKGRHCANCEVSHKWLSQKPTEKINKRCNLEAKTFDLLNCVAEMKHLQLTKIAFGVDVSSRKANLQAGQLQEICVNKQKITLRTKYLFTVNCL